MHRCHVPVQLVQTLEWSFTTLLATEGMGGSFAVFNALRESSGIHLHGSVLALVQCDIG